MGLISTVSRKSPPECNHLFCIEAPTDGASWRTGPSTTEIHKVTIAAGNGKTVAPPATPGPNTKIHKYGYVAEIIVGKQGSADLFYYVIQRKGAAEILYWGQELSLQRALERAEEHLEILHRHSA
jgi:hypothetical protein